MKFRDQIRANTQIYVETRKGKSMMQERGFHKNFRNYYGAGLISRARVSGLIGRLPLVGGVWYLFDKLAKSSHLFEHLSYINCLSWRRLVQNILI